MNNKKISLDKIIDLQRILLCGEDEEINRLITESLGKITPKEALGVLSANFIYFETQKINNNILNALLDKAILAKERNMLLIYYMTSKWRIGRIEEEKIVNNNDYIKKRGDNYILNKGKLKKVLRLYTIDDSTKIAEEMIEKIITFNKIREIKISNKDNKTNKI